MSQQEFVPREGGQARKESEGTYPSKQQAAYQSKKRSGDMPKNDHPSTFESFIPPYGYSAQDARARAQARGAAQQSYQTKQEQVRQRRGFSPDGDALENGYHPERQTHTRQVPPWARPQQNGKSVVGLFIGLALLIIFIKPIITLVGFLFAALAGIAFIALFIPLLIMLFLFLLFSIIGFTLFFLIRSQRTRFRRGPWITWMR